METSNRGRSPGTRKAVAKSNLDRKVSRLRCELATIAKTESDRLLAQSPNMLQVIFLLQEISESENPWSDRASELAEELQSLIVEQSYQESIVDSAIQCDAYIV